MLNDLYVRAIAITGSLAGNDSYLSGLPIVKHLSRIKTFDFTKRVTFFVGENGTGKSTFLEAIAVSMGFNAEGGSKNFTFSTKETESPLHEYLRIAKANYPKDGFFLRAESFYNVASYIDDLDSQPAAAPLISEAYGGDSLHHQSHGESFMSLVQNRFRGNGLYILDEPEAALSQTRQMSLLAEINRLVKNHSQFIIATHSPILLAYPDADIFVLSASGIQRTAYENTEPYRLTKQFLDNHQRMIQYLFEDE